MLGTVKSTLSSRGTYSRILSSIGNSFHGPNRHRSLSSASCHLVKVPSRTVIKISGQDSFNWFQGLVTNDVRQLEQQGSSIQYAFMLNNRSRIYADMFLYQVPNAAKQLLVEIDSSLTEDFMKLLKMFKIRRKVEVKVDDEWDVSSVFFINESGEPTSKLLSQVNASKAELFCFPDPRCSLLGYRLLSAKSSGNIDMKSSFQQTNVRFDNPVNYITLRYRLGIGEGADDFPKEDTLPFEVNGDLVNAISLNKGCYIGQELTARTFHTGVIRKRMVPLQILDDHLTTSLPSQNIVDSESGQVLGKFRVNCGQYGLGIVKYKSVFDQHPAVVSLKLAQTGQSVQASRPSWWPQST